jgi:hypothetical protein
MLARVDEFEFCKVEGLRPVDPFFRDGELRSVCFGAFAFFCSARIAPLRRAFSWPVLPPAPSPRDLSSRWRSLYEYESTRASTSSSLPVDCVDEAEFFLVDDPSLRDDELPPVERDDCVVVVVSLCLFRPKGNFPSSSSKDSLSAPNVASARQLVTADSDFKP